MIDLGDVVRAMGRAVEAKGLYEQAIASWEAEDKEAPTKERRDLWLLRMIRRHGLALHDLGDFAGAATDVRRSLALWDGMPARWGYDVFETACCHAALAGLAGRAGSGVSTAEGEAETGKAMEALGRAVAMGYRSANEMRIESALDSLRSREDFRLLMSDLTFPADPFPSRMDDDFRPVPAPLIGTVPGEKP